MEKMSKLANKVLNRLGWFHFLKKVVMKTYDTIDYYENVSVIGHVSGLQYVNFEGKNAINDRCEFNGEITVGYATTLGKNNLYHGIISIGKYTQIGVDVAIHTQNHPIKYMTTYINHNLFKGELKSLKEKKSVEIGNDVWIGHGVTILGGVRIGNGAIVGAGSVVTKDIPAYTIASGVPAKVMKKRFHENIISQLEELKWWDKSDEELQQIKPLFLKDLSKLTDLYEEKI